jgi:polysaccharide pyruvyl transferase WcaK-like protein
MSDTIYKIRLIGWYGHNATGDDLIAWCIKNLFYKQANHLGINIEFTEDIFCDLVLIGGGTIIGCDTSEICHRIDKVQAPIGIFGPGFRNTGHSQCQYWQPRMRALFDRAIGIGVRGPKTAEALKQYQMADYVDVIGDAALTFESLPIPWKPPHPLVGVCVREMRNLYSGGEERYTSAEEFYRKLTKIIPEILKRLNAELVFISFAENVFDSDHIGAKRLKALLPNKFNSAPIFQYSDDVRFNPSIIGELDYVISERMHPSIIAWILERPCVMLENQYGKATDFMKSIDMEKFIMRTDDLEPEKYFALFDKLMLNRSKISESAQIAIHRLKSRQFQLVDQLLKRTVQI